MTGTGGLQRIPKDFIQNWRIPLPAPDIQQQIVADIEREQAAVNSAKELIEIFTKKSLIASLKFGTNKTNYR